MQLPDPIYTDTVPLTPAQPAPQPPTAQQPPFDEVMPPGFYQVNGQVQATEESPPQPLSLQDFYQMVADGLDPRVAAQIANGDPPAPTDIGGPIAAEPLEARVIAIETMMYGAQRDLQIIKAFLKERFMLNVDHGGYPHHVPLAAWARTGDKDWQPVKEPSRFDWSI